MAKPRMDLSAFVGKLLEEQDGDVLREGIRVLSQALMETEVAGLIGAERHERTGERTAYRNGARMRTWDTRMGTIELAIPKVRPGTYFPSLLQPRRRAEHALLAVVREATAELRDAPVEMDLSVIPVAPPEECGPLVAGSIRSPAIRSIGRDTSSMDGMLRRVWSATSSRAGPMLTVGSGSASRMSTMALGGVRYPVEVADCATSPAVVASTAAKPSATDVLRMRVLLLNLRILPPLAPRLHGRSRTCS